MTSGISNIVGKTISAVTKPDALAPIIALETTVVSGRTYQAHRRGGADEARERVIEETSGSLVWLGGVRLFNHIGNVIIGKILKNGKGADVDTGKDAVRKPFNNFLKSSEYNPKGLSEKTLSLMKFGKVAASILMANALIGFVVPNFNHKLTNYFRGKKKNSNPTTPVNNQTNMQSQQTFSNHFETFKSSVINNKNKDVSFKGGLNAFTNIIENTNAGKLLSTDAGTIAGRSYNARKKQEKIEIVVRDAGSIYFYMWAQGHVRNVLNKVESGRWTRLDPNSAKILHNHMNSVVGENQQMSVADFRKKMFGEEPKNLDMKKFFADGQEAISLDKFNSVELNPDIQQRALKMSELQPKQLDTSVLTRNQVKAIYQKGEMNSPKLLKPAYEKYTNGASSNPNKFVSQGTLKNLRGRMSDYVNDICKAADKNGGMVDRKLLSAVKNKNMKLNGINFVAGFVVASAFLSTLIPKFQYWVTKKMTGVNAFPGVDNSAQQQAKPNNTTTAKAPEAKDTKVATAK